MKKEKKTITINVYVSCPKDSDNLNNQKVALGKWLNNIEKKYTSLGENKIEINAITYGVQENRRSFGEKSIKKSDIVIFLFDEEHDEILFEELSKAVNRGIRFRKPEVFVYVSRIDEENEDFQKIKLILKNGGWVPEPLSSTNKLLNDVEGKIKQYVRSFKSIKGLRNWSMRKYYGFWYGLPITMAFICLFAVLWINAESRRLLIVGGGSARQYIEDSLLRREIGTSYLNWYAAMPSGESYRIIAEERIKNYKGKSYKYRPYYPIVISAQMASEKDFLGTSTPKEFRKTGIIIGIHLTDDWLVAYGSEKVFDGIKLSNAKITASALDSMIYSNIQDSTSAKIDIYTTSVNSGTINTYLDNCDSLRKRDSLSIPNSFGFSNKDLLPKEENHNNKWIALGSFYYFPKNQGMEQLNVVLNSDLEKISKPIYVYFMLYKDNDSYILPKATNRFLKRIKIDRKKLKKITKIDKNNMNIIYNDTTRVLYDYDSIFHTFKNTINE